MNPFATKSHLSVDTKNRLFLFYQEVMHSSAVTVTEVTKGGAVLLSLLSLSHIADGIEATGKAKEEA